MAPVSLVNFVEALIHPKHNVRHKGFQDEESGPCLYRDQGRSCSDQYVKMSSQKAVIRAAGDMSLGCPGTSAQLGENSETFLWEMMFKPTLNMTLWAFLLSLKFFKTCNSLCM